MAQRRAQTAPLRLRHRPGRKGDGNHQQREPGHAAGILETDMGPWPVDVMAAARKWRQQANDLWSPGRLHAKAREYDDSAAGLDGWTGSEIRTWPCAAWQAFSILLSRWSARGQFPSAWQAVRQVHLPKTEAEPNSGECAAKDMRPIAIMSILWRVVSSTVASGQETTAWASAVLHEDQYGGSEGDSCAKAWWPWPAALKRANP